MSFPLILLWFLLQATNVRKDPLLRSKFLEIDVLLSTGNDVVRYIEDTIDPVDVALVFICFMIGYLVRKRRQLNRRLIKELAVLKVTCSQNDKVISGLQPFLEDCRSKNSIIEMPLRRLARSCGKLIEDVDQQMVEINGLSSQFSRFKNDWKHQATPYVEIPLSKMLAHVEEAKIHAELKRLKMFIDSELNSVRSVMGYNKYLLGQAEEDVDRLLIADGNITWLNRSSIKILILRFLL
ncbi:unnamed protein product [Mytilus coruscus]|uniref:Uncharacterized protein n=1 Tax=Mytilus coruscus TaxID=42192 RepID=A0A6J8ALC5_MYTCO|nr:unnamed protein product [Mytilus coruscus]